MKKPNSKLNGLTSQDNNYKSYKRSLFEVGRDRSQHPKCFCAYLWDCLTPLGIYRVKTFWRPYWGLHTNLI